MVFVLCFRFSDRLCRALYREMFSCWQYFREQPFSTLAECGEGGGAGKFEIGEVYFVYLCGMVFFPDLDFQPFSLIPNIGYCICKTCWIWIYFLGGDLFFSVIRGIEFCHSCKGMIFIHNIGTIFVTLPLPVLNGCSLTLKVIVFVLYFRFSSRLHLSNVERCIVSCSHVASALQQCVYDVENATNHGRVSQAVIRLSSYLVAARHHGVCQLLTHVKWTNALKRQVTYHPSGLIQAFQNLSVWRPKLAKPYSGDQCISLNGL